MILDETYRDFLPDAQARPHTLFTDPAWPAHLVQLYSFSKAYCIPGYRMGAVAGDARLIEAFMKALDCLHICPHRGSQAALSWAIPALVEWRAANRARINRRAETMRAGFQDLSGWRLDSLGAYFAYVRHPFAGQPSMRVAERLAVELGAVGLPGGAFGPGQEDYVRLAFAATDHPAISDFGARMQRFGQCGDGAPA